jgi:hypothetical protein
MCSTCCAEDSYPLKAAAISLLAALGPHSRMVARRVSQPEMLSSMVQLLQMGPCTLPQLGSCCLNWRSHPCVVDVVDHVSACSKTTGSSVANTLVGRLATLCRRPAGNRLCHLVRWQVAFGMPRTDLHMHRDAGGMGYVLRT